MSFIHPLLLLTTRVTFAATLYSIPVCYFFHIMVVEVQMSYFYVYSPGVGDPGVLPPDHVHLLPDTGGWDWHWQLQSPSIQVIFNI